MDLEIEIEDVDVIKYTKVGWNKFINVTTENIAFTRLLEENQIKTKTKHLKFEKLKITEYL